MEDLLNLIGGVSIICLIVLNWVIKDEHDYPHSEEYPYEYFSNLKYWRKKIFYIFLITFGIFLIIYGNKY